MFILLSNVLVLLEVYAFYVKLELSYYKIYYAILSGSINQELDSIDQKSCRLFFLQNFQLSPKSV